jgi:gamma-glutamylcyclotransferase (GGCT)/AIG2-like uncharacterized protein YtfP
MESLDHDRIDGAIYMNIPNDYLDVRLAKGFTIADYQRAEVARDREAISAFVRQRFTERYVTPLRPERTEKTEKTEMTEKHGFCTMAICCLMVEALESFWQGWENTSRRGQGQKAFCLFFDRESDFEGFRDHAIDFYRGVRSGILHQSETTNGWRIRRSGPLFCPQTKTINATKFHDALVNALDCYCEALRTSDWEDEIWRNFRKKMKSVIVNCSAKDYYFAYGSNLDSQRLIDRAPSASFTLKGYVKDKQVVINKTSAGGFAKANLTDMPHWNTWGVVFEIDPQDWPSLDKIEEGYDRREIQVWLNDECWLWAQTYISSHLTANGVAAESYKAHIILGAEQHHLPQDYLDYLRGLPAKPD